MRFRKRPIEIEAIQFDGTEEGADAVAEWAMALDADALLMGRVISNTRRWMIDVETREGTMTAYPGYWIIREPFPTDDRRFYPCKPNIFESTYEPVEDPS